jgi:hypothetical protein
MVKVWATADVSSALAHNTPVKKERMVNLLLRFGCAHVASLARTNLSLRIPAVNTFWN